MKKCLKCDCELIDDLNVFAYGAYKVELSRGKRAFSSDRAKVSACVCPQCMEVTFAVDEKGLGILQKQINEKSDV